MGSYKYCMRCSKKWAECTCKEGPTMHKKGIDWDWDDIDLIENSTDEDLSDLL
jgi:hypothetical protein